MRLQETRVEWGHLQSVVQMEDLKMPKSMVIFLLFFPKVSGQNLSVCNACIVAKPYIVESRRRYIPLDRAMTSS